MASLHSKQRVMAELLNKENKDPKAFWDAVEKADYQRKLRSNIIMSD